MSDTTPCITAQFEKTLDEFWNFDKNLTATTITTTKFAPNVTISPNCLTILRNITIILNE